MNIHMTTEETSCFKIILLGDTGVGKSCILLRLKDDRFEPLHDVTVGVTFSIQMISIGSESIKLQLWDTAGQEIFRSITRSYFRDSSCAIIVYDVTKRDTFDHIQGWINDVKELAPANCLIAIVGNKIDLKQQRSIPTEEAEQFAQDHGCAFFETSAATGENVKTVFEECTMMIYTQPHRESNSEYITKVDTVTDVPPEQKHNCC